ncbi:MAG: flavin-containing monooxygenase [Congregibacter sp.]
MKQEPKGPTQVDMVVVGAGFAGLYMIYKAREEGLSVACFEAGTGVGGTWFWNRYPGARVDIECMEYSYSFSEELQQEWEWTERYAAQPEIERYANHVADRFDLRAHITFGSKVTSAIFDQDAKRWRLTTALGDEISAKYCVMATGLISAPLEPTFEGLEQYRGEQYMTSRWPRETLDFHGKRVAVVGTGSSGIQVITELAKQVDELFVLQRTPAYTIPLRNHRVERAKINKIKHDYQALRDREFDSFGGFTLLHSELSPLPSKSALEVDAQERRREYDDRWASGGLAPYYAYTDTLLDAPANETLAAYARERMRERVNDPRVAEKLCPGYPILTRRLSPETNYLEVYNQKNVTLVDLHERPIRRFTRSAIVVGDDEIAIDAVVFATGFDIMTGAMDRIDIRGRGGASLKERWAKGLTSYLGMTTHGFPNFFWINGPQSPFFNPLLLAEYQSDLILGLIKTMDERAAELMEARSEAEQEYVNITNEIGQMTLFAQSDNYYMGDNVPGKPRNILFFLGGFPMYRELCDSACQHLDGYMLS